MRIAHTHLQKLPIPAHRQFSKTSKHQKITIYAFLDILGVFDKVSLAFVRAPLEKAR